MPECLLPTQGTGVYNYRFVYKKQRAKNLSSLTYVGRTGHKYCFKQSAYSENRKCNQLKKIHTTWLNLVLPGTVQRREKILSLLEPLPFNPPPLPRKLYRWVVTHALDS